MKQQLGGFGGRIDAKLSAESTRLRAQIATLAENVATEATADDFYFTAAFSDTKALLNLLRDLERVEIARDHLFSATPGNLKPIYLSSHADEKEAA